MKQPIRTIITHLRAGHEYRPGDALMNMFALRAAMDRLLKVPEPYWTDEQRADFREIEWAMRKLEVQA